VVGRSGRCMRRRSTAAALRPRGRGRGCEAGVSYLSSSWLFRLLVPSGVRRQRFPAVRNCGVVGRGSDPQLSKVVGVNGSNGCRRVCGYVWRATTTTHRARRAVQAQWPASTRMRVPRDAGPGVALVLRCLNAIWLLASLRGGSAATKQQQQAKERRGGHAVQYKKRGGGSRETGKRMSP
jgi:hypothetical protein